MSNAIDTPSKLTAATAANLKKQGITHVGRYLGHDPKGIDKAEADAIKAAGLQIFSIYEATPTEVSYFTAERGKHDAIAAAGYAHEIGQPANSAIYFTVDYDVQAKDFPAIMDYFKAVRDNLKGYFVGVYGGYAVLTYLQSKNLVKYFMQTYAWSNGLRCKFNHIFQYQNDKKLAGLDVDLDYIQQADCGAWGKVQPVQQPAKPATPATPATPKPTQPLKTDTKPVSQTTPQPSKPVEPAQPKQIGVITVTAHTVIRKGPGANYDIVRTIEKGEVVKCYGIVGEWYNAGAGYIKKDYATFKKI